MARRLGQWASLIVEKMDLGPYFVRFVLPGQYTNNDVVASMNAILQDAGKHKYIVVVDARGIDLFGTNSVRKGHDFPDPSNLLGVAIVIDPGVGRTVLRFIFSIFRPNYTFKIFADEDAAMQWAVQKLREGRPLRVSDDSVLMAVPEVHSSASTGFWSLPSINEVELDRSFMRRLNLPQIVMALAQFPFLWKMGFPYVAMCFGFFGVFAGVLELLSHRIRLQTYKSAFITFCFLTAATGVWLGRGLGSPMVYMFGFVVTYAYLFQGLFQSLLWGLGIGLYLSIFEIFQLGELSPTPLYSPEQVALLTRLLFFSTMLGFTYLMILYSREALRSRQSLLDWKSHAQHRVDSMVKTMTELARFNYQARVESGHDTVFDSLAVGINLLAENLEHASARIVEQERQLGISAKMAAMGELLAGVSHELNNPLLIVTGSAELLREDVTRMKLPGTEHCVEHIDRILEGGARMQKIVQHFLRFGRTEGRHFTPVIIQTVVRNAVEFVSGQLQKRNIEVVWDLCPEALMVKGDAFQLEQMVMNLLTNARDAITEVHGSQGGVITLKVRHCGDNVEIEVLDNGPGIDATISPKIFDPFFTTKSGNRGTGLGLSLCHSIVTEHGGTIVAQNLPSGGASFRVTLPLQASGGVANDGGASRRQPEPDSSMN